MSHYYDPKTREARHFVPKKDGSGTRPTTISDCRKLNLVPGPSTVLALLNKPALIDWKIRQGVYAYATSPTIPGESIDDRITRILDTEAQHEEEAAIARDLGTAIHDSIQCALESRPWDQSLKAYVDPVMGYLAHIGRCIASERILVGRGYAGKTDCIIESDRFVTVVDFKTTKKLPERDAWPEAKIQVGAYCGAIGNTGDKLISGEVIYVSTTNPGEIKAFRIQDWKTEYRKFELLLRFWQLQNGIEADITHGALPF
jgi:hypothetical protein